MNYMNKWKMHFLESTLLGQGTDRQNPEAVLTKCIDLAYSDMMTAGRFYSSSFQHTKSEICRSTKDILKNHNFVFSETQINEISCLFSDEEVIGKGNKYASRFGLAQKIVNMSYKYFYVFSDYLFDGESLPSFSKCHCPLDSIILDKASIKNCVWSKLSAQEYIQCQNTISEILKEQDLDDELKEIGNLAFDFTNW